MHHYTFFNFYQTKLTYILSSICNNEIPSLYSLSFKTQTQNSQRLLEDDIRTQVSNYFDVDDIKRNGKGLNSVAIHMLFFIRFGLTSLDSSTCFI